jgi:hypothetical protein
VSRFTTRRPPRVKQSREQEAALEQALRKLLLSDRARAVLSVLVDHSNGAGFCFLKIETLVRESGCSRATVFRALRDLEADSLVERIGFLRSPDHAPEYLPRRARQGQGPSNFRLGAVLRDAARLRDVDPGWESIPDPKPANRLNETPDTPADQQASAETPGRETPGEDGETSEGAGKTRAAGGGQSRETETPITRNENLSPKERGYEDHWIVSGRAGANEPHPSKKPAPDEVVWPDTRELGSEAAILADCQALVDARLADWIDVDAHRNSPETEAE